MYSCKCLYSMYMCVGGCRLFLLLLLVWDVGLLWVKFSHREALGWGVFRVEITLNNLGSSFGFDAHQRNVALLALVFKNRSS